jgi:hypothetical protein
MGYILMKLFLLSFILCSCSPIPQEKNDLPPYSDMGAAEDAGRVTAPPMPDGL